MNSHYIKRNALIEENLEKKTKLKLVFYNINMGASEQAIVEKVSKKLQKSHPDVELTVESHFYYGDMLLNEIQKSKAKFEDKTKIRIEDKKLFEEIKNKYINDQQQDFQGFSQELSTFPPKKIRTMTYRHQEYHNDDYILLKSYRVNKTKPLTELERDLLENDQPDKDTKQIKILMPQTTDCSKYSTMSKLTDGYKAKAKQIESENNYFNDFIRALKKIKPNIVICENVANISFSGKEFVDKIITELTNEKLYVLTITIDHSETTATHRERFYIVGCDVAFDRIAVMHKPRLPEQYLFHSSLPTKAKYTKLKTIENITTIIETYSDKCITKDKTNINIDNKIELIMKLKIFLAINKRKHFENKYVILLPEKVRKSFLRRNGKEKNNKACSLGLTANFLEYSGEIQLLIAETNTRASAAWRFVHSKHSTPTLVGTQNLYFWNLGGHHASLAELAMIQGMPLSYVEKLITYENKIGITTGLKTLAHNLCPKIVSPILCELIELEAFDKKPTANPVNNNETSYNFAKDLEADINLADYELASYQLGNSGYYIYYIANKHDHSLLDEEMIISDLPLRTLHEKGFIQNSKIVLDANDVNQSMHLDEPVPKYLDIVEDKNDEPIDDSLNKDDIDQNSQVESMEEDIGTRAKSTFTEPQKISRKPTKPIFVESDYSLNQNNSEQRFTHTVLPFNFLGKQLHPSSPQPSHKMQTDNVGNGLLSKQTTVNNEMKNILQVQRSPQEQFALLVKEKNLAATQNQNSKKSTQVQRNTPLKIKTLSAEGLSKISATFKKREPETQWLLPVKKPNLQANKEPEKNGSSTNRLA